MKYFLETEGKAQGKRKRRKEKTKQ